MPTEFRYEQVDLGTFSGTAYIEIIRNQHSYVRGVEVERPRLTPRGEVTFLRPDDLTSNELKLLHAI